MRASAHFQVEEFVPKEIFDYFGRHAIDFINPGVVHFMEQIRVRYGKPVFGNTYHIPGAPLGYNDDGTVKVMNERGYRMPFTKTGARRSQHKQRNAEDFHMFDMTPQEIYEDIFNNEAWFMSIGVTTVEAIEMTPGWIHLDRRFTGMSSIKIVVPIR